MTEKTDFTYLKKYGLYVIIAAVGVISIYFIFSDGGSSKNENYTVTDLNTSMPTANRKDLVNDKMQIYYNSERQEEKENRIYNEDFHNNLSNLTNGSFDEEGKESSPYNEKQDTITDRLNEMLAQMEKEKPKPIKKSVPNNHTSSQKINNTVAKVEDPYEEIDMEAWEKGQENDFFATTRKERFAKKDDVLKTDNTIYAVIQGDQIVKHRSRVNLRLSKDAIINGEIFKKNTMFYATATIQYNRLNLKITNIAHEKVDLNVYDGQDGAVGLYVETPNIASAVGNGVTEDVIDETDASNIPFGNTIKNIFSKKQKEERIQLLNNTKLILMP